MKNKYYKMGNNYYKIPKYSDKYIIALSERDYGKENANKESKLKKSVKDIKLCMNCKCDGCYFQRKGIFNCVDELYNQLIEVVYENNK